MKQVRSCILATLLCATAITAWGQSDEGTRKITTSGDSSVYISPDEAVITFGTRSIEKELSEAKAKNDEASNRLTSAVKSMGIEPRYFAMDNMQVDMRFDNNKFNGAPGNQPVGFEVSRKYMVTLKDISKLQPLIDTILTNGANSFDGVTMKSSELRKRRDDARVMAVKAAREKAIALAGALDCTVGQPRSITETSDSWGAFRSDRNGAGLMMNSSQEVPTSVGSDAEGIPLGQIAIRAGVSVTFDLIPAPAPK